MSDARRSEEMSRSPAGTGFSASASLNAAIMAKKQAEEKAAQEKAAKAASLANASQQEPTHASGWWSKGETGLMNTEVEEASAKNQSSAFSTQFGITGQSGMGSSLFNIPRGPTTTSS